MIFRLNKIVLFSLLLFTANNLHSQNLPDRKVFSTAGKDLINLTLGLPASQNNKITFTMGEPIIGLSSISGKRLNMGFIQPEGIFPVSPPSPVLIKPNDPFQIMPNPVSDKLVVKAPELWEGKILINLIDSHGKLIKVHIMDGLVYEIQFDNQVLPGTYFLNFYKVDGTFLQQSKFIKTNIE
jgi:hypothetical protein